MNPTELTRAIQRLRRAPAEGRITTAVWREIDLVTAAAERVPALEALAEAVIAFDGDGLGHTHLPQWSVLVEMARAVLAARGN